MKRLLVVLMGIFVLTQFSCDINDADSSRVVFRFSNPLPSDVVALHVAVFNGSAKEENLVLKEVFSRNSVVTLDVPTGPVMVFAIWAEGTSGLANYYGTTTVAVNSGSTLLLPVQMARFDASTLGMDVNGSVLSWDAIIGATEYTLKSGVSVYNKIPVNFLDFNIDTPNYLSASSSIFNLQSDWSAEFDW